MLNEDALLMTYFCYFWSAGPGAMARSAVVGGVLLALIEGVGIMITRMTAEQFKPGICFQWLLPN